MNSVILEGNITGRGVGGGWGGWTKNACLTTTPSREVAQKLTSATSELGLDREAQVDG